MMFFFNKVFIVDCYNGIIECIEGVIDKLRLINIVFIGIEIYRVINNF